LSALDALDAATLQTAFANTQPAVRASAIRLAEPLLRPPTADANLLTHLLPLGNDSNAQVQLQFLLTASAIADPRAEDAVLAILEKNGNDPLLRDAALTGIGGRELPILQRILTDKMWANAAAGRKEFVAALSGLIVAGRSAERVDALMALIAKQPNGAWPQFAMLDGIADLAKAGKATVSDKRPLKVAAEPSVLAALTKSPVAKSAQGALALFTWPGKPGAIVSVTPPLTPAQELRFKEGRELYAGICGACHQPTGLGQDGLAPPLFDSEWVLGTEQYLARIVLRGMNGKVTVNKRTYEMEMPPLEVLTDTQIAAILTYLRREWGHEAAPIEPEIIARIRTATKTHPTPFTADELKKIK
jgi:mono/diheme cytochrome c family protein